MCLDKNTSSYDDIKIILNKYSDINDNIIALILKLIRYLRGNGYNIPITAPIMLLDMIGNFNFLSKKELLLISKSVFCKNQLEYDSYEDLFKKFFLENEIASLEALAKQEKAAIEENYNKNRLEIEKELKEIEEEARAKSACALKEILFSKFKVYKEHKKSIDDLEERDKEDFDTIKESYIKTLNDDVKFELTDSFINLKENIILELSKDSSEIDFESIKNNIRGLMIKTLSEDASESINELLLNTASTVAKVEQEYKKKIKAIEYEKQSAFADKSELLDEISRNAENDLKELSIKNSTKNHREDFKGRGAVIELLKNTDKSVSSLNSSEYDSLLYYIKANASKFRTKVSRSMKKSKNKQFDYKKTLQKSVKFNGIPLNLFYRKPTIKKYKLFCILDVSGSVSKYLNVLSAFLFELSSVFNGGIEVYGFVSDLIDFTDSFKNNTLDEVCNIVAGYRGYSNYNKALVDFYENSFNKIDNDSIILYFGDARNNKNDTGVDILSSISRKARYSVWLNPEPQEKWNSGDSIIDVYSSVVNATYEINTISHLIYFLNDFSIK